MLERELLIMVGQQLEDIFSIVRKNLRTYLHVFAQGAEHISAERRKSGDD